MAVAVRPHCRLGYCANGGPGRHVLPRLQRDPTRPIVKIVGASRADILLAHRRHQRLIRQHGRPAILQSVTDAYYIVEQWNYWRPLEAIGFRLVELQPDEAQRGAGAASRNAAVYPEIVRLATVLSDSAWRRRLLAKDRADQTDRATTPRQGLRRG